MAEDYSDEARRRRRDETEQAGKPSARVNPLSGGEKEGLDSLLKQGGTSALLCTCITANGNIITRNPRCVEHGDGR